MIWKLAEQRWDREHRAPRIRLGRRYLPGRRGAYGRRTGSAPLIEHAQRLTTEELAHCGIRCEPHILCRGGQVALFCCPYCEQRRRALYLVDPGIVKCRSCAGLRYASEYQGRALEADPDRWHAALQRAIALPANSRRRAATQERRRARAVRALAIDTSRQVSWRRRYATAWSAYLATGELLALRMQMRLARWDFEEAQKAHATARRQETEARLLDLRAQLARARQKRDRLDRAARREAKRQTQRGCVPTQRHAA